MTAVGTTPRGPVVAEDVRDLQSWTGHVGGYAGGSPCSLGTSGVSLSSGAYDLTDDVGGHLGVARRGVELGMSEQS